MKMSMADHLTKMRGSGKLKPSRIKFKSKMHRVMSEFKTGSLHSGSKTGPKVASRKQAIAIGISEAKKAASGGY